MSKKAEEVEKKAVRGKAVARKDTVLWRGVTIGLLWCIWVTMALAAGQVAVGFLLALLVPSAEWWSSSAGMLVANLFVGVAEIWVAIWLPMWVARKWHFKKFGETVSVNRESLGLAGTPTWTDLGLAGVGIFVYLVAANAVMTWMSQFEWFDLGQEQELGLPSSMLPMDMVWVVILLVVVAPIVEEVVFRGYLYGRIRERLTGKWGVTLAIVLVSGLFGLFHGQWNVGVGVAVLSAVMCLAREVTGTIWCGIVIHMLKNALACWVLFGGLASL
jgi:membrane protease YdiL (CAAX protease family)